MKLFIAYSEKNIPCAASMDLDECKSKLNGTHSHSQKGIVNDYLPGEYSIKECCIVVDTKEPRNLIKVDSQTEVGSHIVKHFK